MKVKRWFIGLFLLLCACSQEHDCIKVETAGFFEVLDAQEGVRLERELESTVFVRKGLFWITQPLDVAQPEAGTYEQRVMVAHKGFDRPTLFLTEGYEMRDSHFEADAVMHEIARKLNLNVVYAEHRCYGASLCPQDPQYTFLTVKNSANDLHRIYALLRPYYPRSWGSAGTSKNGMTAMYYQMYYPQDMAIAVPYAAPLPHGPADTRLYPYLRTHIGTPESRKAMDDFLVDMLERRAEARPLLQAELDKHPQWKYRLTVDELYDVVLIDYNIGRWQYATQYESPVPQAGTPIAMAMQALFHVSSIDAFSYTTLDQYSKPYYIQSAKETGGYLMDWDPELKDRIQGLTVYEPVEDFFAKYLLPEGSVTTEPTGELSQKVEAFYRHCDPAVLFIYSKQDPWTSMGLTDPGYFKGKKHMHLYIHPAQAHHLQISDFPQSDRIFDIIAKALEK